MFYTGCCTKNDSWETTWISSLTFVIICGIHSPNQYQKQNSRINKQKIPQVLAFLKCGLPFFVLSKLLEKWRISFRPHFGNAVGLREFYCKCFKNQTCNCKTRLTNKCRVLFLRSKTIFNCSFSSVSCFVGHPVQPEKIQESLQRMRIKYFTHFYLHYSSLATDYSYFILWEILFLVFLNPLHFEPF